MKRNLIETLMGAFVLLVAAGFGFFAYDSSNISTPEGIEVFAKFDSIDGLKKGSDVRIGGVKVGVVFDQQLDNQTYLAVVKMSIDETVKIPSDSTAAVISDGLLGSKYVSITPGGSEKYLNNNEEIKFTQSSVNLETLIGKVMFSDGGVEE